MAHIKLFGNNFDYCTTPNPVTDEVMLANERKGTIADSFKYSSPSFLPFWDQILHSQVQNIASFHYWTFQVSTLLST